MEDEIPGLSAAPLRSEVGEISAYPVRCAWAVFLGWGSSGCAQRSALGFPSWICKVTGRTAQDARDL